MAIRNLYPNLSGHLVEFRDGGLSSRTNDTPIVTGESILIIGTAVDGLVNEPIAVDIDTIGNVFGSEVNQKGFPNGSTLIKAAKQARKAGFSDIRCMRATGTQASYEIKRVTSSEESEETVTKNLGVINGNDAVIDHTLTNGPIIEDSMNMTVSTPSGTSVVGFQNLRNYSRKVNINAGLVSAGAIITAEYSYKNIKAKKEVDSTLAETGGVFNKIAIEDLVYQTIEGVSAAESGLDQYGYPYVSPSAAPVKVTVKTSATATEGATLTEGSDFTWSAANKEITISSSTDLAAGDIVTVEYVPYELANATETISMVASLQEFNLQYAPIAGSEIMTIGATRVDEGDGWSYKDATKKIITIDPALFNIASVIRFTYNHALLKETSENLIIRSKNGGNIYNDSKVQVVTVTENGEEGKKVILTKPESKKYTKTEAPLEFTSFDYPTLEMLCSAINNAALNNVFEAITDTEETLTVNLPLVAANLSDGSDGISPTNNQMFEALTGKRDAEGYLVEAGTFQMLEHYNVDAIYVAGIYADSEQTVNPNSGFHRELALLCAVLSYRNTMTRGYIDFKPNSNPTLRGVQNHFKKIAEYNNTFYMIDNEGDIIYGSNGNPLDIGWYTSLCVGPEPIIVSDTLGTYFGSPAIAYAGLVAGLKPQSSPTNKKLNGVKGMRYKFSNAQLDAIVGNRMVAFKTKNEGTVANSNSDVYVVDGVTCGAVGSDYGRITTVRVVTDVVDQIRDVADPFIGEPNTQEQRNALSAAIEKRLSRLIEDGVIQWYNFSVTATIEMVLVGECLIDLNLVAPQDLRKINTVVSLRAAQ